MPRETEKRFEDRGQSQRPPNPKVGARNQGGRYSSPSPRTPGSVAPPPVSRARKDSIMRPVNENRSTVGGIEQRDGQGAGQGGPPDRTGMGGPPNIADVGPPGQDRPRRGWVKGGGGSQRATNQAPGNG
jgi:hypothetical protein